MGKLGRKKLVDKIKHASFKMQSPKIIPMSDVREYNIEGPNGSHL